MNRGKFPFKAISNDETLYHAIVVGAGASAPTVPANATIPGIYNLSASATRSAEGVYVVTLSDITPQIITVVPEVRGANGRKVTVSAFDTSAKTISILAWGVTGVADDLESTDTLVLTVVGRDSTA